MEQRPAIHVVEDDDAVRDSMALLLEVHGFIVRTYASAAAFFREARLDGNCCLIVDMHTPGMSGVALLNQLRQNGINVPAIVMTGMVSESIRRATKQLGAVVLEKPYHLREVVHSIETAVGRRNKIRSRGPRCRSGMTVCHQLSRF